MCEIEGDNNWCQCQTGVGRRQDQLACSFWDCQSLSAMSATTLQLPVSIAYTLRIHPAEVSSEPLASTDGMSHNHIGESMKVFKGLSWWLDQGVGFHLHLILYHPMCEDEASPYDYIWMCTITTHTHSHTSCRCTFNSWNYIPTRCYQTLHFVYVFSFTYNKRHW